jgi:hypothetical protein
MSDWFELPDAPNGVQGRFLDALRKHTRDWPPSVEPEDSGGFLIDGLLITYVDVCDDDEHSVVATFRVDFDGSSVYADRVTSGPIEQGRVHGLGATGSPESCAAEAARWYLQQLGRAVERHEWFENGERVHVRWRFAGESGWLVWADRDNDPREDRGEADRVIDVR